MRAQLALAGVRRARKYMAPADYTPTERLAVAALIELERGTRQLLEERRDRGARVVLLAREGRSS